MANLILSVGILLIFIAAFFYTKRLGKQQEERKKLKDELEAIDNAKQIEDDVANMSLADKRKWMREHLQR